jgi:hypothetical protein
MYVNLESKKTLRPLLKEPKTVWVHKIPSIENTTTGPDGKPIVTILRRFAQYACTSTGKGGVGCKLCSMQDPLWSMIKDEKTKFNKKGAEVHFPKGVVHLMPVYEQETTAVKLLKGGNQLYAEMDKWHTSQPDGAKDLRRCDWIAWKEGKGLFTKYQTSRLDTTPFEITEEMEDKALEVLTLGNDHLKAPDIATLTKLVNLIADEEDGFNNDDVSTVVENVTPMRLITTESREPPVKATVVKTATTLEAFQDWMKSQAEFNGPGLLTNVVPVLQKHLNGSIDYHTASPEKLAEIKTALVTKLTQLRGL